MSRGRVLLEAIDREHRRTHALILARLASVGDESDAAAEPEQAESDAAVNPQTWLE